MRCGRGFAILEVVVALLLVLFAFAMLQMSWKRSRDLALHTRARAAAVLLAQSLLEEIRGHDFGSPAPAHWEQTPRAPLEYYVDGRLQALVLRQRVSCETGAFLGRVSGDRDQVTVRVEWDRPAPLPPGEVEVKVPVWRD